MDVWPAIDIKDGRCVRLRQGRFDDETVFADEPLDMATRWVTEGAAHLHIVDLDGAASGTPANAAAIRAIAERYPEVQIQVGGGIRSADVAAAYLAAGVARVVIGTRAVQEPAFVAELCAKHPGCVVTGLDARDGKVATDGWAKTSTVDVSDLACAFEGMGVAALVFTDIARDGMMEGMNTDATAKLARNLSIPVIASGGVTTLDDVRAVKAVADAGISGVIIGRALYEATVALPDALAIARA